MSNEETLKDYYEPPSAVKVKRDGNRATQQYFKEKQDLYLKGEITFEECRKEIYNSRVSSVNSITKMKRVAFYKKKWRTKDSWDVRSCRTRNFARSVLSTDW
jgi:hypothetical protein